MANRIYETTQYDRFKLLDFNRDVKRTEYLEKSMLENGFLSPYPLHVVYDKMGDFLIKAGHHRFYVAKKLGIPVKYVISEDNMTIYDLEKSTNPWTLRDYLDSHCRRGENEYLKVKDYCEWTGITLSQSISLLAGENAASKNHIDKFKQGIYIVKKDRQYANIVAKTVLHLKGVGIPFFNAINLVTAISKISLVPQVSIDRLNKKITSYKHMIEKKANLDQYMIMLEDIYNKGSKDKLPIKFLVEETMRQRQLMLFKK